MEGPSRSPAIRVNERVTWIENSAADTKYISAIVLIIKRFHMNMKRSRYRIVRRHLVLLFLAVVALSTAAQAKQATRWANVLHSEVRLVRGVDAG